MTILDKNRPTREWIESLRKRFPCEVASSVETKVCASACGLMPASPGSK